MNSADEQLSLCEQLNHEFDTRNEPFRCKWETHLPHTGKLDVLGLNES